MRNGVKTDRDVIEDELKKTMVLVLGDVKECAGIDKERPERMARRPEMATVGRVGGADGGVGRELIVWPNRPPEATTCSLIEVPCSVDVTCGDV